MATSVESRNSARTTGLRSCYVPRRGGAPLNAPVVLSQAHQRLAMLRIVVVLTVACAQIAGCNKRGDNTRSSTSTTPESWFVDVTEEVGLDFVHETGARGGWLMPEIMASGVAMFDYDGDDDLDLYFTTGHLGLPNVESDGGPPNRLYRQDADGRFVDVTESSGLGDRGYGMGVAVGDIDNDGDLDVYVTNYGPDRLYRNRGDGTFEDVTKIAGVSVDGWSCSAAFFDFDRDGWLDIFVTQYLRFDAQRRCYDRAGRRDYCGPGEFRPVSDVLLRNEGDGRFRDVSEEVGLSSEAAAGLGVVCEDFDQDGWPDVFIANDGHANHLWFNRGDGTFRNDALVMGVAFNLHGQAEASMGVLTADLDGDTDVDLFMTHLRQESNTFYRNLGPGMGFGDATSVSGLGWSSVEYTGFGTVAFDAELDGDLDLAVVNGRVVRADPLPGSALNAPWNLFAEPNLFYLNDGSGKFSVAHTAAAFSDRNEVSRGMAMGDVDRDGDIDLVISNLQGPARLFRNEAPRAGHWLVIRATDPRLRRDAIGARITVSSGGRRFVRSINAGSSYLSASQPEAHFGLGESDRVESVEVKWPDGLRERFMITALDRYAELVRGRGESVP